MAIALSTAASAQAVGEFPAALDEANLRAWLAARTNMQPQAVVSIGSNSIIGIKSSAPDPAGPGRHKVQIRAEVINARTAAQGGYMSWSSDLEIDCTTRRSRALGITNYPARNLSGTGTVAGGPSANWVTPTIGTQLYSLVSAICDQGFQRPLGGPAPVQTATRPAPPQAANTAAPPTEAQRTAPAAVAQAAPPLLPVKPFERPAERSGEPPKMQVVVAPPAPAPTGDAARPPPAGPPPADFSPPPPPPAQVATAPPASPRTRPRPRGASGAGVQVAAGPSQAGVRSTLARVQRMSADWSRLSAETVQANVRGRTLYRGILHGFASQGEANAMCERLKARGGACFVRQTWR